MRKRVTCTERFNRFVKAPPANWPNLSKSERVHMAANVTGFAVSSIVSKLAVSDRQTKKLFGIKPRKQKGAILPPELVEKLDGLTIKGLLALHNAIKSKVRELQAI